jgi:CubicO group peptidase (beta-lactamase class C family)
LRKFILCICILALGFAAVATPAAAAFSSAEPDPAAPQPAGFSTQRLQRLDEFLQNATDDHGYLGAVTLIARHGKLVELRAFGQRDVARKSPMRPDSIFRIYSMSKTVTTVAALMLMEQGKLGLDDPVARYLPEFADVKVFAGGSADTPQLRAPSRAITIHDLLTHTAGFATGGKGIEQPTLLLERADLHGAASLKEYVERLAHVPLATDPGTRFGYDGASIEPIARLVEVVSGMPFERYLQMRIFDPLQMVDTGFTIGAAKRERIADLVTSNAQGKLVLAATLSATQPGKSLNSYPSGAGGLYSTASDYARFCQMLLNGGALDGASILGRKTVALMFQNHLTQLNPPVTQFTPAEGFGLGGSVVIDAARRGRLTSTGAFGWSGAAGTYYTIDPQEDLIALLLTQYLPGSDDHAPMHHDLPKISTPFYNLVYQALIP